MAVCLGSRGGHVVSGEEKGGRQESRGQRLAGGGTGVERNQRAWHSRRHMSWLSVRGVVMFGIHRWRGTRTGVHEREQRSMCIETRREAAVSTVRALDHDMHDTWHFPTPRISSRSVSERDAPTPVSSPVPNQHAVQKPSRLPCASNIVCKTRRITGLILSII